MNHEKTMNIFFIFMQEQERRQEFRKNTEIMMSDYEYYQLNNMLELEDKSQTIIKQELLEIAKKSMDKTIIYQNLMNKETEVVIDLVEEEDFKFELFYLDSYNNILKKVTEVYWKPTIKEEKLLELLIKKSLEYSREKTFKTLEYIKKWENNWCSFIEKQILFYKLEENLKKKNQKDEIKKL